MTNLLGTGANGVNNDDYGKALWAMAAVAAEPDQGTEYDLILLANTVGTAPGTILIEVWYTAGD